MSIMREFQSALNGQFDSAGSRTSIVTAGINRTRVISGPCYLNAISVIPDDTNAPTTTAFWSLDDSTVSASGSGGTAVLGSFFHQVSGAADRAPYVQNFLRGIPFDSGLCFNYTATGTGLGLKVSIWLTPRKDPSLP